jgi:hypothetical protein
LVLQLYQKGLLSKWMRLSNLSSNYSRISLISKCLCVKGKRGF